MSADAEVPDPFVSSAKLLMLLFSLLFLLVVVPMLSGTGFSSVLWRIGITMVIFLAAIATTRRKMLIISCLVAFTVATPANWVTLAIERQSVFLVACFIESAFFAWMAVLILVAVTRKHLATVNSIYGAICSYLLFGLAWSMLYLGVARGPNNVLTISGISTELLEQSDVAAFSQLIYFSFVTMSTLGYGDLLPVTPAVRTMAWIQSVAGQFYIAVIVAWLVSEIPRRKTHKTKKKKKKQALAAREEAKDEQSLEE